MTPLQMSLINNAVANNGQLMRPTLIEKIVEEVSGIAKRAQEFEENPDLVRGIIAEGCERARTVARDTLDAVRQAMAMNYR